MSLYIGDKARLLAASSHSIIDSIPKENHFVMLEAAIEYDAFRRKADNKCLHMSSSEYSG